MQLQEKPYLRGTDSFENYLGLYLHVPFCATTCDFCAFYQEAPSKSQMKQYLDAVKLSLSQHSELPVNTVFWGGGTPGMLPSKVLGQLGDTIRSHLSAVPAEWSIELAPSTVNPAKLKVLREAGVNRVSMGIQSFDDTQLKRLGRDHKSEQALRAYDRIREAGFDNVNIDLMFATPGQTMQQWESDLKTAIQLDPEHISTYCLTFEEDTALWLRMKEGKEDQPDPEREASFYTETWDILESSGYGQYEVSNFAKPDFKCQHNLHTWQMHQWLGIGPSASSQYMGARFTEPASIDDWASNIQNGTTQYVDYLPLNDNTLAEDALIFGLRMNDGVCMKTVKKRFPLWDKAALLEPLWRSLSDEGYCHFLPETETLKLTQEGRLLVDAIGAEIIAILNP